jgi:hypothetical protein
MARNSKDGARREFGPFERAALTSRLIGVAALTLGAVTLYA